MKEVVITSIQDYIEKTLEDSYNAEIQRYRTSYVFRGMSDKDWKLDNTLMRNCGSKGTELEEPLIRNFSKYAAKQIGEIPGEISIWKKLATAQHYGLPTRLLDWSYNPLVALHFATNKTDEYNVDGVVWGLNFYEAREVLPEKLKEELDQSSAFVFTNDMLIESVKDLSFSNVPSKDNYLLFYEPPAIDDRIINQYGIFSLPNNPEIPIDDLLDKKYFIKYIIPKELKPRLRDELDQLNVNERTLFPDLKGITKWLSRHYRAK